MTSAKLYIYIGVGSRDLFIDEAHMALGIFPVFFLCMLPTTLCGIFRITFNFQIQVNPLQILENSFIHNFLGKCVEKLIHILKKWSNIRKLLTKHFPTLVDCFPLMENCFFNNFFLILKTIRKTRKFDLTVCWKNSVKWIDCNVFDKHELRYSFFIVIVDFLSYGSLFQYLNSSRIKCKGNKLHKLTSKSSPISWKCRGASTTLQKRTENVREYPIFWLSGWMLLNIFEEIDELL